MTYKELSVSQVSQFTSGGPSEKRHRSGQLTQMMMMFVRLMTLTSLMTVITSLPAVFDIIPVNQATVRQTNQSFKPCLQLRASRHQYVKCQQKIKRKRMRRCLRKWLEKTGGNLIRHRNSILPCLHFRER